MDKLAAEETRSACKQPGVPGESQASDPCLASPEGLWENVPLSFSSESPEILPSAGDRVLL